MATKKHLHSAQMPMFDGLPSHDGNVKALRMVKERDNFVVLPDRYKYVQRDDELANLVEHIRDVGQFTVDCESTGLTVFDYAVALQFTVGYDKKLTSYFVPTDMIHAVRNFTSAEIREAFEEVFADPKIGKTNHNIKYDMHQLRRTYGIDHFAGIEWDTEIAQWVLNENEKHDLETVCRRWLDLDTWKHKQDGKFHVWPIKSAIMYGCGDSEAAHLLRQFQETHYERPELVPLRKLYLDVEMPTMLESYDWEKVGIAYDMQYHENVLVPEVRRNLEEARAHCREYLGNVNLGSSEQVAGALYDGIGLPRQFKKRKPTKANPQEHMTLTVDKSALAKLRGLHPVIPWIEKDRKFEKVEESFVHKLPGHIVAGRIHTNLHTIGTRTGRMSCTTPNLQQLPKRSVGPIVRRAFIPSQGCILISMDLSQIELRLLAHYSQDANLLHIFRTGQDIHAATTSRVFGYTLEEIKANEDAAIKRQELIAARIVSKNINFGILYGMGPGRLMDTANDDPSLTNKITLEESQGFVDSYFEAYPGVVDYIDHQHWLARKQGYVTTLLGRKRRLPDIYSRNRKFQATAERQSVNAPIQGSAADFVKVGTLNVSRLICENHWPYQILLQIHDELLMEVPVAWYMQNQITLQAITKVFQNAIELLVPVEAKAESLSRWGDKFVEDDYEEEDAA